MCTMYNAPEEVQDRYTCPCEYVFILPPWFPQWYAEHWTS